MPWPNPDQHPALRGEMILRDDHEMERLLEEKILEDEPISIPQNSIIAGQRPLSNILFPTEENINIVRINNYLVNGSTAYPNGIAGTETLIDSVIPANNLIISCPTLALAANLYLYISLGSGIKVVTSPIAGSSGVTPDQTDLVLSSYGANADISPKYIKVRLPLKRHLISCVWGLGSLNFGTQVAASFIWMNLRHGGE
jgi:hypothetical protein